MSEHIGSEVIHADIRITLQRDHFTGTNGETGSLLTFLSVQSLSSQLNDYERDAVLDTAQAYYPTEQVITALINGIAGKDSRL